MPPSVQTGGRRLGGGWNPHRVCLGNLGKCSLIPVDPPLKPTLPHLPARRGRVSTEQERGGRGDERLRLVAGVSFNALEGRRGQTGISVSKAEMLRP